MYFPLYSAYSGYTELNCSLPTTKEYQKKMPQVKAKSNY